MTLFEAMERAEALVDADAVDKFAGPGGWSVACHQLGISDVGVELDRWACATRRAAGFATVEADVSHCDPRDYDGVRGLISSPPCQAFSTAGAKHGRRHVDDLIASIDARRWSDRCSPDARVWLALEVGRWWDALRPRWVALEQVPAVLPLWQAYARMLDQAGYSTWCGVLNAADYGVPQIRKRAVLIASLDHQVGRPAPTHAKGGEGGLRRWVTMAEALGWVDGAVGFPRRDDRGGDGYRERDMRSVDEPAFTLTEKVRSWSRVVTTGANTEQTDGVEPYERDADRPSPVVTGQARQWNVEIRRGGDRIEEGFDPDVEPAQTVTTRVNRWQVDTGRDWKIDPVTGETSSQTFDPTESPALALTGKSGGQWLLNPGLTESQPNRRLHDPEAEPAPTIAFGHDAAAWAWERPATTIAGDPRAFHPGSHRANDGRNNDNAVGRSEHTIRLTIADALTLQSFPPDYPVRGGLTKAFEQIGNAVPPGLARAILATALGVGPTT